MTERFVPDSVACLRPFVDAGVLGMVEVHVVATFVNAVARSAAGSDGGAERSPGAATGGGAVPDDVVLAAALAVRGPLHGHVRVDLADVATSLVPAEPADEAGVVDGGRSVVGKAPDDEGSELDLPAGDHPDALLAPGDGDGGDRSGVAELRWPDPIGWADRVLASPLARDEAGSLDHAAGSGPDEPDSGCSDDGVRGDDGARGAIVTPLVVAGTTVYLDRYWRDEVAVAADLTARASVTVDVDDAHLRALEAYLPAADAGAALQRAAVDAALRRQLVVIAGGPGTGKTRTVARLLTVLASGSTESGRRPPEIALAAPTGKAAARMDEAIAEAVRSADPGADVVARLDSLEARTVHRLLGARRGGASFTHDAADPIAADVVVVDEVSMVSLPLMARLLDAVRPDARVVVVGDPYQLASVEAGAVLGDLVGRTDGTPPVALCDSVVVLERVFRFGVDSPVGRLAAAIKDGDPDVVVAELRAGTADSRAGTGGGEFVRWVDPDDDVAVDSVRSAVLSHATDLVDSARNGLAGDALASLGDLEVLCATRRGPLGVDDWNRWVEHALRAGGRMRDRLSAGRPVMVTANDYVNGVFNGDVGVVVRMPAEPGGGRGRVQVAFDGAAGPRLMDPTRLDRLVTQWAMTIHKSQGSEFGRVVVTLPPPPSPILTRELLYTAVTRARSGVTVVASEGSIRAAVDRPVARASGLASRLA